MPNSVPSTAIAAIHLLGVVFIMKITVKVKDVEITVDEQGQNDRTATMRYTDQNNQIQETLKVMVQEALKLQASVESSGS